jgi:1-deoxy-D-xylulose-5-phosphate synthase
MTDLLASIQSPAALRALSRAELRRLADELRACVLENVSRTGGHLSSNLGTVELTIALHYVFDTPNDRIVWDVGHQTYPHKILTGRREAMPTLRQWQGLSGFPKRDESPYDTFGTAHSSTSISAALGMALASRIKGERRHAIAVIGDGAMTAGEAFEALNNAGVYDDLPFLVVLNDNDMSISPPVGALNQYLTRLMSGQFYSAGKESVRQLLRNAPAPVRELAHKLEEHAKAIVQPSGTMFEEFGFNYLGPIDGHDLDALIPALENIKALKGPQFLHVVTRKGRGYKLAEADPVLYHGPGKFNPSEGIRPAAPGAAAPKTYTQVFGEWLCDAAAADARVVGVTPAMREGSGLVEFEKRFPERYYDVGIAEQHAVTFAGGLATEGLRPVVAIYSTFLQRGYDQLIHDVALQNLPVLFAIDRGGLVGADGATHAGAYDMAYLRCIPNMVVMAPADENECRQMLQTALGIDGPSAVRYPRGAGPGVKTEAGLSTLPVGRAQMRRQGAAPVGRRVAILAFGSMVALAEKVAEEFDASVINMRFVKPLDEAAVLEATRSHDLIVTLEEGSVMGGAGTACVEALNANAVQANVLQLGLPDTYIDQGTPAQQLASVGLDAPSIAASIRRAMAERLGGKVESVATVTSTPPSA